MCVIFPCCLYGQDYQPSAGNIPFYLLGYRNDSVLGLGYGMRPSALPALKQKNFSFTAGSRYNVRGCGMFGMAMAGGNGLSGTKIMLSTEVSPVHYSLKGELGYGMMLSKSLSVGVSVGTLCTKMSGNKTRWLPHAEVGFIYQMSKKISWGANYRQSGKTKAISTGMAYQLTEQFQLVAEIEKGSYNWLGFSLLVSTMLNEQWLAMCGYKGHSGTPFSFIGHLHKKQIMGAGLSFHPMLGPSVEISFSKFFQ